MRTRDIDLGARSAGAQHRRAFSENFDQELHIAVLRIIHAYRTGKEGCARMTRLKHIELPGVSCFDSGESKQKRLFP